MEILDFSVLPPAWHWTMALITAAMVGSFLTVATTRIPRRLRGDSDGPTTLGGRSYCPHCGRMIPFYRNIPLLTWLLQRGRTACCSQRIPVRYFLLEVGCLVWATALLAVFGFSLLTLLLFVTGVVVMALAAKT